jgi:hypothetical protein
MSDLRKHLQAEKTRYQEIRYPGNLGQDLLPQRVLEYRQREFWQSPLWRVVGGLIAAAAVIAIAIPVWHKLSTPKIVYVSRPAEPEDQQQVPIAMDQTESMPDGTDEIQIAPTTTGGFVPEYQSMTFPTIPSFMDSNTTEPDNQTQQSKESA